MHFHRMAPLRLLLIGLAVGFTPGCSYTRIHGVKGDVKDFVTQYVAAFNAQDIARLESFEHPKSLACVTPDNKEFYDRALSVQIRDGIPPNYQFKTLPALDKDLATLASYAAFPVRPSLQLHIEYSQGEDSRIQMLYLVQENGRWYQVEPCFTQQTLKQFREDEPARKARVAQTTALVAAIKDPLRGELLELLREHKTVTATKRYQEASGQNYETAMFVIYELTPEVRRSN